MTRIYRHGAVLCLLSALAAFGQVETVTLDGQGPGRTFEGLGGLSAGAGSRLLMDYPKPQRDEILDFLFKPDFGAALQHLKVEIGSDVNSSEGSEPSYARTRDEFEHPRAEYFQRGYEWWLMREAKKRNPAICLDVLQWGAPDWIGDKDFPDAGDPNTLSWEQRIPRDRKKFFTQDDADFIAGFIQGAKKYHGLDIDYCGTWNETPGDNNWDGPRLDVPWIKLLRQTLDHRGLTGVKIVARDCGWKIAELMEQDAELKNAIDVVGAHYPEHESTPAAKQCGKPLWASEDHAGWQGGPLCIENHPGFGGRLGWAEALALAKLYNLNYIKGRMTKTTICYLIASYYDSLSWPKCAAIWANSPWSGHYEIWPPLWAMAHTTQFAQPGWRYLDGACAVLKEGGSCVCLRSPEPGGDYSAVIETGDAKKPQTLAFHVTGGLSSAAVHLWRSSEQSQLERQEDIPLAGDSFAVRLEPGCIYSLTTTTGQHKGKTAAPPLADFPFPYRDNFDGYTPGKMARYFAEQSGAFEVAKKPGGGNCLRQTVSRRGIDWEAYPTPEPYTIIGSPNWRDYEVSCDARIESMPENSPRWPPAHRSAGVSPASSGGVSPPVLNSQARSEGTGYAAIFGRIKSSVVSDSDPPRGYWLKLGSDGRWELKVFRETLASGTVAFSADPWHKLALAFSGSRIAASIDSIEVKAIEHDTDLMGFGQGMAGLGSGWNNAQFAHFSVREIPQTGGPPRRVNLARGKKATASSNYSDNYDARLANDGNPFTRWNSAAGDAAGAWLEVDFGQPTRFNRVAVRQLETRIQKYKIQYLDGAQWRDAFSGEAAGECWSASFAPVQAGKVRLLVVSTRNNITPSIFEFAVYNEGKATR
jgi:galactosylceramidase